MPKLVLFENRWELDEGWEEDKDSHWVNNRKILVIGGKQIRQKLLEYAKGQDIALKKHATKLITAQENIGSLNITATLLEGTQQTEFLDFAIECSSWPRENNILRLLFEKIPEKVGISLYLKYEQQNVMHDFAIVEGMKIDPENFSCMSTIPTIPSLARRVPLLHVQLVADIEGTTSKAIPFAQKLLAKESFSDVIISAENGAEIKAHKSFLSVCSPVFEAMFSSEMEESQTGQVDMSDVSEEGVRAFLRYVYFGDLQGPVGNMDVAFELFCIGHKYDVPGLEAEIKEILLGTLNRDFGVALAFKMYMFAKNIDTGMELKIKAIQIIKANWDEFETHQEYKDLFEKPSNSKTAMEVCRDLVKTASEGCSCPLIGSKKFVSPSAQGIGDDDDDDDWE